MGKSNTNNKSDKTGSYTEFYYHFFRNILLVSVPLLIISALILGFAIPHSSAEGSSSSNTSSDSLSISISSACTLSSSIDRAHTVNVNAGTHTVDIGSTRVNAYCNDNNGYSIYAIGSSNDVDGNTDLISSINDNYNIKTGIYDEGSSSSLTPSSWGMKLAPGIGTGLNPETGASIAITPPTIVNNYDNYNVVPSNYILVASRASGTNMTIDTDITGSYFTTTYDVYASSVQPAGTYNGKVKYMLIHPHRDNNNIGFNEAFALSGKSSVGSYYAMQDMTTDICNMVNVYDETSQTELMDTRDGKLYWVAKLQDGHCWMTQNLDLDLDPAKPLTSNDTDLTDHSLTGAYTDGYNYDPNTGITTWVPAISAKTINFEEDTVSGWNSSCTEPYSANKIDDVNTSHISLGNYYNLTSAIASNNSSSLASNTSSNILNNPQNSICSKGWRLPTISNQSEATINSTNEFARLNYLYNNNSSNSDTNLVIAPLWFMWGGIIKNSGTLSNFELQGNYLSSTINGGISSFYLLFSNDSVKTNQGYSGSNNETLRDIGRSVRCVAR